MAMHILRHNLVAWTRGKRMLMTFVCWQRSARYLVHWSRRSAVASLTILSLGLLEPFACIIHCAFLDEALAPASTLHHHTHLSPTSDPPSGTATDSLETSTPTTGALVASLLCNFARTPTPRAMPLARAFHECVLAILALWGMSVLLVRSAFPDQATPLRGFRPLLFRPPNDFARG